MIMQKASYEISREKAIWKSFLVYAWSQTNELVLLTLQSKKRNDYESARNTRSHKLNMVTYVTSLLYNEEDSGRSFPSIQYTFANE